MRWDVAHLGGAVAWALLACHASGRTDSTAATAGRSAAAPTARDSGATPASQQQLQAAIKDYLGWTQRTQQPESISNEIFSLCRSPTAKENAFANSEHGMGLFLLDWLNPVAMQGFENKGTAPFPIGAAIVKQKLMLASSGKFDVAALGIMVKREAGFDDSHGDWEFGYWEAPSGLLSGATESAHCGGCHAGSATDFVFLDQSWHKLP